MGLYFAITNDMVYVKIGVSNSPKNRFEVIQTHSPCEIGMIYFTHKGAIAKKRLHDEFKRFNTQGEWFYFSEEICQRIIDLFHSTIRSYIEFYNAESNTFLSYHLMRKTNIKSIERSRAKKRKSNKEIKKEKELAEKAAWEEYQKTRVKLTKGRAKG